MSNKPLLPLSSNRVKVKLKVHQLEIRDKLLMEVIMEMEMPTEMGMEHLRLNPTLLLRNYLVDSSISNYRLMRPSD